jgi:hypothetical protein
MAKDLLTINQQPAPAKPAVRVAKAVEHVEAPTIAADKLAVRRAPKPVEKQDAKPEAPKSPPSPVAAVPGEEVRNTVSITGTVLGPIVTLRQSLGMLATATFKSPVITTVAKKIVSAAGFLNKFKVFNNPLTQAGMRHASRALPFIGAGILAFDGYATVRTFMNPEATGTRKALTAGRFLFNAIATGVSFIPGAGFIYSLLPGLIGNGFEVAMARLNAKEAAKAQA